MALPERLRAEIEASLADGPEAPSVAEVLAAGHALQRRRRVRTTTAAVAVVALLGTGVAVGAARHDPGADRVPAATQADEPDPTVLPDRGQEAAGEDGAAPDLVGFAPGDSETLLPLAGVRILDQQAAPAMPRNFAPPAARTAVAVVRWDGETWFVLAREPGRGTADYLPTTQAEAGGARTLEEFLAWVRPRYTAAGGTEGLR